MSSKPSKTKSFKKESKEALKSVIGSLKSSKSVETELAGNLNFQRKLPIMSSEPSNKSGLEKHGDVTITDVVATHQVESEDGANSDIKDSTYSLIEASQFTPENDSESSRPSPIGKKSVENFNVPPKIPLPDLPESDSKLSDENHAHEEKALEKPYKKHTDNPIALYRLLHLQRSKIKEASEIMSSSTYATLSSIGYGSLFLSYLASRLAAASIPTLSIDLAKLSAQLKSLSSLISDWRTFYRVWGTMGTIEWAIGLFENPDKDIIIRYCDYTQAVAGVLYQVLEDLAYLASKKVIRLSGAAQTKLWVVSCYFWATHVFVEFAKLARSPRTDNWERRLMVNLVWLPLTIHWSTESGFLNDGQVGFLGSVAYLPTTVNNWRAFFKC
jgi:Peroxisomal biogenesis factor 11 (PEX11)